MSTRVRGSWVKLSTGRKLVMENLYQAQCVPTTTVSRALDVSELVEARRRAVPAPSWNAIFMRAFALVARDRPELRRSYIRWPWGHFYDHPHSVCAMVFERELDGEMVLLAKRFRAPEEMSLETIDRHLHYYKDAPLEKVGDFRRLLRAGSVPLVLRRLAAWAHLHVSGCFRSRHLGTFMMSSIGSLGTKPINPPAILSSCMSLGPISPTGQMELILTFDHRVTDGRPIALAMNELDRVLHEEILDEIRSASRAAA